MLGLRDTFWAKGQFSWLGGRGQGLLIEQRPLLVDRVRGRGRPRHTARLIFAARFAWEAGGIFVGAFTEAAAEACGQADAGFTEFVAQLVGCGEGIFPPLLTSTI